MRIETQNFRLTPGAYFKIIATKRLKTSWWLYIGYWGFAIFFLKDFNQSMLTRYMVIFGFAYPVAVFGFLLFWAYSQRKSVLMMERRFILEKDRLITIDEDDTKEEIQWKQLLKITAQPKYWLFYIAKGQFVCLPKDAFQSEEDQKKANAFLEKLSEK